MATTRSKGFAHLAGLRDIRHGTLLRGTALGGVLLAALALVGVTGGPETDRPHAGPAEPGLAAPLVASQPELRGALLGTGDLPRGYAAASPQLTRSGSTPASRDLLTEGTSELCRALFERPWDLAPAGAAAGERRASSEHTEGGGTVLRQVATVFQADGAVRAFAQLRESAAGCHDFSAALVGGDPAEVRLRELPVERAGDEAYALEVTVVSGRGTLTGYLAFSRVGRVLSVLREIGPEGAVEPGRVGATLRRVAQRLSPLARLLDHR